MTKGNNPAREAIDEQFAEPPAESPTEPETPASWATLLIAYEHNQSIPVHVADHVGVKYRVIVADRIHHTAWLRSVSPGECPRNLLVQGSADAKEVEVIDVDHDLHRDSNTD